MRLGLVDYRLLPKHRYPTMGEYAWAALRWTADHVEVIGGVSVPILVAGDSAGGNLAAIMASGIGMRWAISLQVPALLPTALVAQPADAPKPDHITPEGSSA